MREDKGHRCGCTT